MEKGKYVDQLTPGSSFSHSLFIAANAEIKVGKTGSPYAMFVIEDRTGSAAAKLWNVSPDQQKVLMSGTFFSMSGQVDNGQYAGQVSVSSLKSVPESDVNLDDFLPPLPDDHQVHYDRFIRLVKSVKNPHLKSLLRTVFGTPADMVKKFRDAVAAKTMHHSHRGGLIEHSSEVAELCDKMCEVFTDANRDLVVSCALLHDIGKIEELEHGIKHGDYTVDGQLIGHIVLGTQIIIAAMGPDFPPILKKLVIHLILSHHGKGEFGSPKDPATPEAFILSTCDLLSAKMYQTRQAIKSARPGQISVKAGGSDFFYAYSGDYGNSEATSPTEKLQAREPLLNFEVECARLPIAGTDETKDVALPREGADYLLKVTDGSMDASGILPGDYVFVKEEALFENDSLVTTSVEGAGELVRRLIVDKNEEQSLVSDDPAFGSIRVTAKSPITGRVTGLFREV